MSQASSTVARPAASRKAKTVTPEQAARVRRFDAAVSAKARNPITFEMAASLAPNADRVAAIVKYFGMEDVDYAAIRDVNEEAVAKMAASLRPVMVVTDGRGFEKTKGLEMHMQRIDGALVGSAHGAAMFYDTKRAQAADLRSKANADRDEDRLGIDGQANRVEQAAEFAAQLGLKAYAALAAAEGALSAYEHVIGSPWKPYEGAQQDSRTIAREASDARAAALGI